MSDRPEHIINANQPEQDSEQGLSILDILDVIKEYLIEILKKIYIPIILGLALAYFMYRDASKMKSQYTATLSFQVNQEPLSGPRPNPLFDYMSNTNTSLEKMMEMMKSRKIMVAALFKHITIDGKDDLLINHFMKEFGIPGHFQDTGTDDFDRNKNGDVNRIVSLIKKNMLSYKISTGEVVTITMKSQSETMTYYLLKTIYSTLAETYITTTSERQRKVYQLLEHQVDSLESQLTGTEKALADDYDSHLLTVRFKEGVRQKKTEREMEILRSAYFESKSNLEIAKLSLRTSVPLIQTIDDPVLPLILEVPSKLQAVLLGGVIGGVVGVLFIVIRKYLIVLFRKERAKRRERKAREQAQEYI